MSKAKLSSRWCGRKKIFFNETDALVAVTTKMRDPRVDFNCFRVYRCNVCHHYHLTKERRESQ